MGANIDKYCTCLNNGSPNEETSLAHKDYNLFKIEQNVIDTFTQANRKNNSITIKAYQHDALVEEEKVIPKIKSIPIKIETSNTVTDRIEPSSTPRIMQSANAITQTISYPNGNVYTGTIVNNKREGKGKLTFAMGGYYNGEFHNDDYDGYGTFCTENTIYHGNFIKGEKEGEGRSENIKERTEFIGNWKYNQRNGSGKEVFADGSYYEGNFINGAKSGNGILHLANECEYHGEFVDDCIEGKGTFIWNETKKYIGNWKRNALSGFGVLIQEKDKHIGYYDNDQKNGFGLTYFFKSRSFIFGNWVDDNIQGLAIYSSPNQGTQLWEMENSKLVHYYSSKEEVEKIKESPEYINFKEFYCCLINNNLVDDLFIKDTFSL